MPEPKVMTAAEIIAQTKSDISDTMDGKNPLGGQDDDSGKKEGDDSGEKGSDEKGGQKSEDTKKESSEQSSKDDKGKDSDGGSEEKKEEGTGDKGDTGDSDEKGSGDEEKGSDDKGGEGDGSGEGTEDSSDKSTAAELELQQLKDQNSALLGQVESLSALGLKNFSQEGASDGDSSGEGVITDDKGAAGKKASDKESSSIETKSVKFVTDDSFEKVLESADGLNELLNDVANRAALAGEQRGFERAIRETPSLVSNIAEKQIATRDAARDFLTANPELLPVRAYLGLKVNELQAKNPSWGLKELFTKAGDAVREDLKLSKVANQTNNDKGTKEEENPALPQRGSGGGGGSKGTQESGLSEMQKEIGNLVEFAEGSTRR